MSMTTITMTMGMVNRTHDNSDKSTKIIRGNKEPLPLGLSDFGLLISLGHDVSKGGTGDGSHKLLRFSGPLLGCLFDHALAVFAAVQHRPVDLIMEMADDSGAKQSRPCNEIHTTRTDGHTLGDMSANLMEEKNVQRPAIAYNLPFWDCA